MDDYQKYLKCCELVEKHFAEGIKPRDQILSTETIDYYKKEYEEVFDTSQLDGDLYVLCRIVDDYYTEDKETIKKDIYEHFELNDLKIQELLLQKKEEYDSLKLRTDGLLFDLTLQLERAEIDDNEAKTESSRLNSNLTKLEFEYQELLNNIEKKIVSKTSAIKQLKNILKQYNLELHISTSSEVYFLVHSKSDTIKKFDDLDVLLKKYDVLKPWEIFDDNILSLGSLIKDLEEVILKGTNIRSQLEKNNHMMDLDEELKRTREEYKKIKKEINDMVSSEK